MKSDVITTVSSQFTLELSSFNFAFNYVSYVSLLASELVTVK